MKHILEMLRATAEPTRLRLLGFCAHSDYSVGELSLVLAQSQPRVSRHLKILCDAGLLERSNEGLFAYYRATFDGPGADFLRQLMPIFPVDDESFVRDTKRLEIIKSARLRKAEASVLPIIHGDDRYASFLSDGFAEQALKDVVLDQPVRRLLDIGTGSGRALELLGPNVDIGVGVDASREMLAVARAKLEHAGLQNCRVRHADLYELPFGDRSFDAVMIHHVLRFVADPKRALCEAARVMAPGARIIVFDLAPGGADESRFSDSELGAWFQAAGLRPEKVIKLSHGATQEYIWRGVRPSADVAV
jgi:ubiquinone/menaquinone biosynthesis C-methylase UbiE/DNA-binding transcriptional ArsR family regulator